MTDSVQLMAMLGARTYHEDNLQSSNRFVSPEIIADLSDLHKIKFNRPCRNQNAADSIYSYARRVIFAFKFNVGSAIEDATEVLENLNDNTFKAETDRFKTEYKEAHEKLVIISDDLVLKGTDPVVYFAIKKHILLGQIFMKLLEVNSNKMNLKTTKEVFNNMKVSNNYDSFELGYFIASEPVLVIGALNAIKFNDNEYIMDYKELVDKFSKIMARKYSKLYLDISGLSNRKFNPDEFDKYVSRLETVRGG